MKKIISVLLLLTMCISIFAGCKKDEPAANVDLENAKTYVFNMYNAGAGKGEAIKLLKDKEVISSVPVDGVTYSIEWSVAVTAGAADSVKITDGKNGNKLVDIPEGSESQIDFTLTATIKAPNNETATVDFKFFVPKTEKADVTEGRVITLYNPASNAYVSGKGFLYNGSKNELHMTENKAEAIALTLVNNADGTVSFKTADGKFLYGDATHAKFVAEEGQYTKFNIEAAEGGSFIKTQGVYGSGETAKPQYLEVYKGALTVYGMGSDTTIYTFELKDADGANGAVEFEQPDPIKVTIAQAITKDDGTMVIVKGTVKEINGEWSDSYNNMNVTIEDSTGATLYVYRLATKVAVGDNVTITGAITSYEGKKQIASGATAVIETATDTPAGDNAGDNTPAPGNGSVVMSDYAAANGWSNGVLYPQVKSGDITISVSAATPGSYGQNTGKYYTSDVSWRMYQADTTSIVVKAAEGKTITSVKITYISQNTGVLTQGTTQIESGSVVTVNANSITFGVGNSGTATNGQVRITAIEVIYA